MACVRHRAVSQRSIGQHGHVLSPLRDRDRPAGRIRRRAQGVEVRLGHGHPLLRRRALPIPRLSRDQLLGGAALCRVDIRDPAHRGAHRRSGPVRRVPRRGSLPRDPPRDERRDGRRATRRGPRHRALVGRVQLGSRPRRGHRPRGWRRVVRRVRDSGDVPAPRGREPGHLFRGSVLEPVRTRGAHAIVRREGLDRPAHHDAIAGGSPEGSVVLGGPPSATDRPRLSPSPAASR